MHRKFENRQELHRHYLAEVEVTFGIFLPTFFSEVLRFFDKTAFIADLQPDKAIDCICSRKIHYRKVHDYIAG